MNLESINPSQKEPFKRSDLLTVLCILTFIGSGLASFSNLFIFLSYEDMLTIVDEYEVEIPGFDMMMSGGRRFFITGFILYTFSWVGALQMWKQRKMCITNVETKKDGLSFIYRRSTIYFNTTGSHD
jgi:hypothetical protein